MDQLQIDIDGTDFVADVLDERAPRSVDAMADLLPLETTIAHVRWSGYAVWIDIEAVELPELPREHHTVYPSRGDILLYPGYRNVQEILIACGPTCFKSPAGELAGNHVATITGRDGDLATIESETLEAGRKPVRLTAD